MPIRNAIWKVGSPPVAVPEDSLEKESLLEDMIVADPSLLSDRWMIIGRQVATSHGGKIDLLAINQDAQLIVIELKRSKTPRDVVAQALDYASWVKGLDAGEVARIYDTFSSGGALGEAFLKRFSTPLDEEDLDGAHQVVVVASSLDPSTERIVNYLSGQDVPINVIFFQVFRDGANQYLSRAWLIDPIETAVKALGGASGTKGEWNKEYYVSFGHDPKGRRWEDAMKYGFISAGGGPWYSKTLFMLSPGDRVWVNVPKRGYVGVGLVTGGAVRGDEFLVSDNGQQKSFRDVALGDYGWGSVDDEENAEYFVPVKWIATRPLNEAVSEIGFFGNQNSVCRPRTSKWVFTVDRLRKVFGVDT